MFNFMYESARPMVILFYSLTDVPSSTTPGATPTATSAAGVTPGGTPGLPGAVPPFMMMPPFPFMPPLGELMC